MSNRLSYFIGAAPITQVTHVRNKNGNIHPCYGELLIKERIHSLWERILFLKSSSHFESGRNLRGLMLSSSSLSFMCVTLLFYADCTNNIGTLIYLDKPMLLHTFLKRAFLLCICNFLREHCGLLFDYQCRLLITLPNRLHDYLSEINMFKLNSLDSAKAC